MIKLYTDKSKFLNEKVLEVNDYIFDQYTQHLTITDLDKEYMMKYDGAKIIGNNSRQGSLIRTKYGETFMTSLSTGLKTLLNLLHYTELPVEFRAIDITECGENVILDVFKHARRLNIPVILEHSHLPYFESIEILVDDCILVTDKSKLVQIIRTKEEEKND